jgi:preprotein translocase subunit SecA
LIDEIENSVWEVVEKILITYSIRKPWNFEWMVSNLKQLSWIEFDKEEIKKYSNIDSLKEYIVVKIINYFQNKTKWIEDKKILKDYIKRVYLSIIDKYWVEHIDDMTYLREKVSLFGYAQIDPLVIYKQESYWKFQKLMANIKDWILSTILKTDFDFLENKQEKMEIEKYENLWIMDLIKKVAWNVSMKDIQNKLRQEQSSTQISMWWWQKAKVLEKTDGTEVFELNDDLIIQSSNKKLRPNDKISVRYKDGSVKTNKYKKLKEDINNWDCQIIK